MSTKDDMIAKVEESIEQARGLQIFWEGVKDAAEHAVAQANELGVSPVQWEQVFYEADGMIEASGSVITSGEALIEHISGIGN